MRHHGKDAPGDVESGAAAAPDDEPTAPSGPAPAVTGEAAGLRRPGVLVAACGNRSRGDDAFGPAVADALAGTPGLQVVDLGMRPAALLHHLEGRHTLVVVDALLSPDHPPGTLVTVDWNDRDRPSLAHDDPLSTHGLSIGAQLDLARTLGHLPPRVLLVGATLTHTTPGTRLTPAVRAQIEPAARWIRTHVADGRVGSR